jgi:hypothetical protein
MRAAVTRVNAIEQLHTEADVIAWSHYEEERATGNHARVAAPNERRHLRQPDRNPARATRRSSDEPEHSFVLRQCHGRHIEYARCVIPRDIERFVNLAGNIRNGGAELRGSPSFPHFHSIMLTIDPVDE